MEILEIKMETQKNADTTKYNKKPQITTKNPKNKNRFFKYKKFII